MTKLYAVLEQKEIKSKHGGWVTEITFVDILDREELTTFVDPGNRNYKNWQHIINNPNHGFVLKNLKRKGQPEDKLINADSKPVINEEFEDIAEMISLIQELWRRQDRRNNPNRFWEMFE
jgi:hypothetical protein